MERFFFEAGDSWDENNRTFCIVSAVPPLLWPEVGPPTLPGDDTVFSEKRTDLHGQADLSDSNGGESTGRSRGLRGGPASVARGLPAPSNYRRQKWVYSLLLISSC